MRLAWGLCLLLRPADTLRLLGDARPDQQARVTVRLLGVRHAVQAVMSGPSPGPAMLAVGVWTDAVHAASAVALAGLDQRRRRLALLDTTVAGTWSLLGRRALRRTPRSLSPGWRERTAQALVQHLPGAPAVGRHREQSLLAERPPAPRGEDAVWCAGVHQDSRAAGATAASDTASHHGPPTE